MKLFSLKNNLKKSSLFEKEELEELFTDDEDEIDFPAKVKSLNLEFGEKQKQILEIDKFTKTICHGSVRSGKTFAIVLKSLLDCWDFAKTYGTNGIAMFIVTASTVEQARKVFLSTVNTIMQMVGIDQKFNLKSSQSVEKIFGIDIAFFGLARTDSYDKIQGLTAFGWFATEVTTSLPENLKLTQQRVSMGKMNKFWDCNPEHPMHYIYVKFILPNLHVEVNTPLDTALIHFNYKDSPVAQEYWISLKRDEKWSAIDENPEDESKLLKSISVDEEENEKRGIIEKYGVSDSELRHKYGHWLATDDMPLKNIQKRAYALVLIKKAYTVGFLDVANTANENSCFSALAVAWRITFEGGASDIFMFTGTVWKALLVDVLDELKGVLVHLNVSKFYYEANGAGAILGQFPEFRAFGAIPFIQKRNKVARILGDSILDRMCGLGILVEQGVIYSHNECDPEFLNQVRNFQYVRSTSKGMPHKVIGYCDAPDALASALHLLVYGDE